MSPRNPTIDAAKGIAIILVVCGHVIQYSMTIRGLDYFLNPAFTIIYTFHMPLFFFISGYLIAFSLKKRSIIEVFKSRCRSLLVPCVAWGMIGGLVSYGLYLKDGEDLGSSAWFLWFLFSLFMVSCLVLLSVALQKYMGPVSFLLVYVLLMTVPYNSHASLHNIKWFFVFFTAGYFLSGHKLTVSSPVVNGLIFALALALFVLLVRYWTRNDFIHINQMNFSSNNYADEVMKIIYRYIVGFLGIALSFYTAWFLSKNGMERFLSWVGTYSLNIYVLQRFVIEGLYPKIAAKAHAQFDYNSLLFIYIYVPIIAAAGIAICIFLSNMIFKKNEMLSRLLLGGRG